MESTDLSETYSITEPVGRKIYNFSIQEISGNVVNLFNRNGARVHPLSELPQLRSIPPSIVGSLGNQRNRRIVHGWGTELWRGDERRGIMIDARDGIPARTAISASASGLPPLNSLIIICCSVIRGDQVPGRATPSNVEPPVCNPDPIMLRRRLDL